MLNRLALLLLLWLASGSGSVLAHDHGPPGIEILQPWAPAMAGQEPQLVYLTIRNRGNVPDRLMRVLSPVAAKVELHTAGPGQGEPQAVAALSIGAGQDLVLGPSGPHLAMLGLKRTLLEHQTFKLALEFDGAGRIVVDVVVGPPAPSNPHRH
jgi:periplasmic copper chaperone A